MKKRLKISFLTDNPKSWIINYLKPFKETLVEHNIKHYYNQEDIIEKGDILFILSCEKLVKEHILNLHLNNIVVHPSKLPKGKGWSPIAWQILEGSNTIPVTLFEATQNVDSGLIYQQSNISLKGHELNDEIKLKQAEVTFELISNFIKDYPKKNGLPQIGSSSYYRKRKKSDSELDINKSIKSQFNLLRVVDNERYPAFFYYKKKKFILTIKKDE